MRSVTVTKNFMAGGSEFALRIGRLGAATIHCRVRKNCIVSRYSPLDRAQSRRVFFKMWLY